MNTSTPIVRVLKITAAQRQLDAAIRMTFSGGDSLAIHTVAAAACRIFRDLKGERGVNVLADEWRDNILGVARALLRDEVPSGHVETFQQDSELWQLICECVEQVETAGADKTIAELRSIVDVTISPLAEKQHWAAFNKASNFLKHANKDARQTIREDEVDTEGLLLNGCSLYLDLLGRLTPEMHVWMAYRCGVRDTMPLPTALQQRIAETLRKVTPDRRGAAALQLIQRFRCREEPGEEAV